MPLFIPDWHEYSGGKLTDQGAHHVDIACRAPGDGDTGPSKVTPVQYTLPVEYKDGHPLVDDRYNAATEFNIRVELPGNVDMIITNEGDNGIPLRGKGQREPYRELHRGHEVPATADLRRLVA